MKIILNSLQDVQDFFELCRMAPDLGRAIVECAPVDRAELKQTGVGALAASMDKAVVETSAALREDRTEAQFVEVDGLPTDIPQPEALDLGATLTEVAFNADDATVEVDATGRPWDEEIDSAAKTKTAKGIWTRSRRRDLTDERYTERAAEVLAAFKGAATPTGEDEPMATETHALPVEAEPEVAPAAAPSAIDFAELIEASAAAALDLPGDMAAALAASKQFLEATDHATFNALKHAVAPLDGSDAGKSLPAFSPGERRTLQAAIELFLSRQS